MFVVLIKILFAVLLKQCNFWPLADAKPMYIELVLTMPCALNLYSMISMGAAYSSMIFFVALFQNVYKLEL